MYFDKFPVLNYFQQFGKETKFTLVTDIIRRVKINTYGKDESTFFIKYDLKDGDTPEIISDKLYDTSDYFWVVLLINEALNPYYDMSLGYAALDSSIKRKYFGKYFYLTDINDDKEISGLTFNINDTIWNSSGSADSYGLTQEHFSLRARVVDHDPTYARIRVDGGGSAEYEAFEVGDYIGVYKGQNVERAKINRIEDGVYALNHFETATGGYVDPLAAIADGTPLGLTGATGDFMTTPPQFYQTRLGVYLGISGARNTDFIKTNYETATELNDDKRSIKLIHPDYLDDIVAAFESIIQA